MAVLILIYLRVSTEEQARRGYSLPEQREACRRRAAQIAAERGALGELELAEFVDDFGGDVAERPVLEAAREFVRSRRPAWFLCMDPDRFSRSLKLQLIVADDIEAQGTRLAFVQQEYDPDDLMSRAFFQFRGLMSELDKAKILERTTRGKRGKLKAGLRPNGAAPYGYRHHKETDRLEIYEPEAVWVRRVFEWATADRLGVQQIAQRLNGLGVPCKRGGGQWYRSVVTGLLRNTTYYGEMRCNRQDFRGLGAIRRLPRARRKALSARLRPPDEWVMVPAPAIIERERWTLAQAALAAMPRRSAEAGREGLLSGLVRCGHCGGGMGYARRYLRCHRRYARSQACPNPHHRAELVEAAAWAQLTAWLTGPALTERYLQSAHDPVAPLEAEQRSLLDHLETEHRVQALAVRRQARGELSEAAAGALLQESARHVARCNEELTRVERRLAAASAASPRTLADEIERTGRQLGALCAAQRRQLLRLAVHQVMVSPDGQVTVTLRDE